MAIIRIKSSHPESQGAFVEIEDKHFDAETMIEYVEGEPQEEKLTVAQMKEKLTLAGVEFDETAKKKDLQLLVDNLAS